MKVLEGNLVANGSKIAIVAARFNEFIVSKLVSGCVDGLVRHNPYQPWFEVIIFYRCEK